MKVDSKRVEQVLDWVREHPLPGGRIIPVCLWSDRGAGKTALVRSYCMRRKFGFRGMQPAHSTDGSDIVGLRHYDPRIERTVHARPLWLPSENDPINWSKRGVIFIDEINRSPRSVLRGLMEPLGEGTIDQSGWKLPEDWAFVCAANPPRPGYDVDELDEALMDRMLHIPLGFDVVRWIAWADSTDIPEDVVGFTARFPDMMAEAQSDLEHLDIKATPRSMEYLARLYEPGMDLGLLEVIAEGLIGRTPAESFLNHVMNADRPVSAIDVLSGEYQERLSAHLEAGRDDLVMASRALVVGKLAAAKYRPGTDEPLARQVAGYAQLLGGSDHWHGFWEQLASGAPHWAEPVRALLDR